MVNAMLNALWGLKIEVFEIQICWWFIWWYYIGKQLCISVATATKMESLRNVLKAFTISSLTSAWQGEDEFINARAAWTIASAPPWTPTPNCGEDNMGISLNCKMTCRVPVAVRICEQQCFTFLSECLRFQFRMSKAPVYGCHISIYVCKIIASVNFQEIKEIYY